MKPQVNYIPSTITSMLEASAEVKNDADLIYEGKSVTFKNLYHDSKRTAAGLATLGIGLGDRVGFWLPNTPAYLTLYFACARLGAIVVAINTRFRASEVEDVLERTGTKALIMWPNFRGKNFAGILEEMDRSALERLEVAILYSEEGHTPESLAGVSKVVRYESLFEYGARHIDSSEPSHGCNIFTTSGTTKAPKFVLHSNESMAIHAAEVAQNFGYRNPLTVVQQDMPLCGVFGITGVLAAIAGARKLVLTSAFDADLTVDLMVKHKVTHFDGSDEMIDRLLHATNRDDIFERISFAGYAFFNSYLDDIVDRAERRGLYAVGLWGMSEMQALVTRRDRADPVDLRKKGGGRPVSPRAVARVRDPRSGKLCVTGMAGELEIKGPSRMLKYFKNPEATSETLTDDGFVRTGDLAQMEPEGGFEFLARMGDVLRLGGFLVSPAEIEAEIQCHPGVADVQVVSAPIEGADRPFAFIVTDPGTTIDESQVLSHCANRLAKFKIPIKVAKLEAFPVTESANGMKVKRTKLREMAIKLLKNQ